MIARNTLSYVVTPWSCTFSSSSRRIRSGTAGQTMMRLVVDDPDLLFQEYEHKGVFREGTQLSDTSWATREFAFWDLNHNGLTSMRDL